MALLAHLSLPLLDQGEVYFEGKKVRFSIVLKQFDWQPIVLQLKEGLVLLNGMQFISAYGTYIFMKVSRFFYLANLIGTILLKAFDGRKDPFHQSIHFIRPHKGQISIANRIKGFLAGS